MKIFENFIADLVLTDCKNNLFSKIGLILENSCENQNRMVLKIWWEPPNTGFSPPISKGDDKSIYWRGGLVVS